MIYLVDSDWTADYLAGRSPAVEFIGSLLPSGVAISAVTYMEVMEGVRGSRNRPRLEAGFDQLLRAVRVIDFNRKIASRAADIRRELRDQKHQVHERALDILIAATAIEHNLILVTRNIHDYEDIPDLRLYEQETE